MTPEEKKARKREADKKYRETHKEQLKEYYKKYRETHRDEINEKNKKWAEKNREVLNEKSRQRYKENPQPYKDSASRWVEANKDYVKERSKKYRQKRIEYNRQRSKNDPKYRFRKAVWTLINKYMHKVGYTGNKKVWDLIGCDFETFYNHIESQWEEGMSLENYGCGRGKWNIDHIVPISQAKTDEDFERISHYSNLRPMWAVENTRKGKKTPN